MRNYKIHSVLLLTAASLPAAVIYEHLPEANSPAVSYHSVGGPVLADDFDPAAGGQIVRAEWWGTATQNPNFEVTLHFGTIGSGGFGNPVAFPPGSGGFKYFVSVVGIDPENDGIFYYAVDLPGDFTVLPGPRPFGNEYWFSVANSSPGWTWAYAGAGPTVGDEHWNAVVSTGSGLNACPDGGPHCGPWSEIQGRDFAFRLDAVPEPGTFLMVAIGAGLVAMGRRHVAKSS